MQWTVRGCQLLVVSEVRCRRHATGHPVPAPHVWGCPAEEELVKESCRRDGRNPRGLLKEKEQVSQA